MTGFYWTIEPKPGHMVLIGPFDLESEAAIDRLAKMSFKSREALIGSSDVQRSGLIPGVVYYEEKEIKEVSENPKEYGYRKIIKKTPTSLIHPDWKIQGRWHPVLESYKNMKEVKARLQLMFKRNEWYPQDYGR